MASSSRVATSLERSPASSLAGDTGLASESSSVGEIDLAPIANTAIQNVAQLITIPNAFDSFDYRIGFPDRSLLELAIEARQAKRQLKHLHTALGELIISLDEVTEAIGKPDRLVEAFQRSNKLAELIVENQEEIQRIGQEAGQEIAEITKYAEKDRPEEEKQRLERHVKTISDLTKATLEKRRGIVRRLRAEREATQRELASEGFVDMRSREAKAKLEALRAQEKKAKEAYNRISPAIRKLREARLHALREVLRLEDQLKRRGLDPGDLHLIYPEESAWPGFVRDQSSHYSRTRSLGQIATAYATDATTSGAVQAADAIDDLADLVLHQRRFSFWASGTVSGFEDDETRALDGDAYALSAGARYSFLPELTLAVAGRARRVEQNGAGGTAEGNYLAGAVIASTFLFDQVSVDAIASYEHGETELEVRGLAADYGTDSLTLGLSVHDRFWLPSGLWIEPEAGASYSWTHRSSFTDSAGTRTDAADLETGTVNFGPSAGIALATGRGDLISVEPHGRVQGIWQFERDPGDDRLGVSLSGGLGFTFTNRISASLSGGYVALGSDFQSWSGSLTLGIPLN